MTSSAKISRFDHKSNLTFKVFRVAKEASVAYHVQAYLVLRHKHFKICCEICDWNKSTAKMKFKKQTREQIKRKEQSLSKFDANKTTFIWFLLIIIFAFVVHLTMTMGQRTFYSLVSV